MTSRFEPAGTGFGCWPRLKRKKASSSGRHWSARSLLFGLTFEPLFGAGAEYGVSGRSFLLFVLEPA